MNKISIREQMEVAIPAQTKISLQESAQGEAGLPEKITTVVEAIHSGMTRNYTFYPSDNLERSVSSWTQPYEKPVIKNHDIYEEPLGRVKSANFKQSNITPDKYTIELEMEITDTETIKRIMDGRYQTLSIGGNTNSAICSICAKDLVKEGYCGHQKGRTYEGKQAHWIIGEMDFDEISWVNVPADRSAQVVQKNLVKQEESSDVGGEGGDTMNENADKQTEDILDQIDLLNKVQESDDNETPEETPADNPEGAQTEGDEPAADEPEGDEPEEGKADPAIEDALATAEARIQTLEAENTTLVAERDTLQDEVTTLTDEVATLKQQVADLEAELTVANEESANAVKQNVQLASYTHKTLAESVANLQLVLGEMKEEEYAGKLMDLSKETSRSLKEKVGTLSKQRPQRVVQKVENPLHAEDGTQVAESTSKDKQALTLDKYAEKILQAMNRNYTN